MKGALLEASLLLAFAQVLTKLVPYAWWSRLLGPPAAGEPQRDAAQDDPAAHGVARAVHTAARHLPWAPVCLPRAMAAKWMLARRNVASTLVLGIRRPEIRDVDDTGNAKATDLHAWLRVGDRTVTGGDVADAFTVIAHYGTQP